MSVLLCRTLVAFGRAPKYGSQSEVFDKVPKFHFQESQARWLTGPPRRTARSSLLHIAAGMARTLLRVSMRKSNAASLGDFDTDGWEDKMKMLKIAELRPTQVTHGVREIRKKTESYLALSGHDLQMAIAEKPIPIVCGPGCAPYAIDHHHVATALWHADIKSVPVVLVKDLSSLSRADFWLALDNNRWTYPYDAQGRRIAFSEIPRHIWDLDDDDFRSLSAAVRDAGGYAKTTAALEEFRWADFFRSRLHAPDSDEEFDSLVKTGIKLAKSTAALGLPGYLGPAD